MLPRDGALPNQFTPVFLQNNEFNDFKAGPQPPRRSRRVPISGNESRLSLRWGIHCVNEASRADLALNASRPFNFVRTFMLSSLHYVDAVLCFGSDFSQFPDPKINLVFVSLYVCTIAIYQPLGCMPHKREVLPEGQGFKASEM